MSSEAAHLTLMTRLVHCCPQNSTLTIEEFHSKLQEATNFPLRPFVIPFLKVRASPSPLVPLAMAVETTHLQTHVRHASGWICLAAALHCLPDVRMSVERGRQRSRPGFLLVLFGVLRTPIWQ